jgi:subtilisin-like proprotein convertase family protein
MQVQTVSHSSETRSRKHYRLAALVFSVSLMMLVVGSFTMVSAQSPTIFTGDSQEPKSGAALALPEAAPVYTNLWAVQLAPGRDLNAIARSAGFENLGQIGTLEGYYLLRASGTQSRNDNLTATLRAIPGVIWAEQQIARQQYPRVPSDPQVTNQWHLNNTGQFSGTAGADANVFPAWNAGITGSGVQIAIVDDGLQITHPDIAPNYFAAGSYDFNDDETNPTGTSTDAHGTSAGGVAAAADDGAKCGVGAAYNAQVAGLRLIAGPATDAMETEALTFANNQNDIYNNSWGPSDNGSVLAGPGPLLLAGLQDGVTNGRGGLGSVFVWAGGNGGNGDHSNADGYANSRFVIAVAASTNAGVRSNYSELGANIMVNAPSSGGTSGIITTDLTGGNGYGGLPDGDCTNGFGGTSSAAPLVAGISGLILEANPALTYRDVMHILIDSAEKNDPSGTGALTWATNGAGYDINYAYGFGRVDAGAAVALADTWTNVPASVTPFDTGTITVNQPIPDGIGNPGLGTPLSSNVNVPQDFVVEHVEVYLDIDHPFRGDLVAAITSPDGTSSTLLFSRVSDGGDNYDNWKTTTLRSWGEMSAGTWTLAVADNYATDAGTLNSWRMVIYGYSNGSTPDPTATPNGPTATPTENPSGGTQLVVNGGFETLDTEGKPVITPWEVKNETGDKVKCNKEGKEFAFSGNCAFRFKGGVGEDSGLKQTLDLSAVTPQQGDAIDVFWAMNVPGGSVGKVKMTIKYDDTDQATKITGDLFETAGYEVWGTPVDEPLILLSSNVQKMKFSISHKSESGKVYFDNVSVTHIPAATRTLALPGFSSASATGFTKR